MSWGFEVEEGKAAWWWHLWDYEISVVERNIVEIDEDVVVTESWDVGLFVELEAVEAAFALDGPLLGT